MTMQSGSVRSAGRLLAAATLLLALTAPTLPGQAPTCHLRQHRQKRICWCWDSGWRTAPMLLCRLLQR